MNTQPFWLALAGLVLAGTASALTPKLIEFPVGRGSLAQVVDFGGGTTANPGATHSWQGVVPGSGDTYDLVAWCAQRRMVFRFPVVFGPQPANAAFTPATRGEELLVFEQGQWKLLTHTGARALDAKDRALHEAQFQVICPPPRR